MPTVPARLRFRAVTVARVVRETADAVSLVLDVPAGDRDAFAYRAGQFVTLRLPIDGELHVRSYSMSSAPTVDADLQVTVKRVHRGLVSNWIHDRVRAGDRLDVTPPAGTFVADGSADPIVAFAAGSGITPVFSIIKETLARGGRQVALCYANRDRAATIFAAELDALAGRHRDRFALRHHHDVDHGLITADTVGSFVAGRPAGRFHVCGPTPFMDLVEATLLTAGIAAERIHLERFSPTDATTDGTSSTDGVTGEVGRSGGDALSTVTVRMGRQRVEAVHRPGTTILQTARVAGLRAPSSCETGSCATCMARVTEGRVEMRNNEALTPDEVDAGWVLTCQAVPVTPTVTVVYE